MKACHLKPLLILLHLLTLDVALGHPNASPEPAPAPAPAPVPDPQPTCGANQAVCSSKCCPPNIPGRPGQFGGFGTNYYCADSAKGLCCQTNEVSTQVATNGICCPQSGYANCGGSCCWGFCDIRFRGPGKPFTQICIPKPGPCNDPNSKACSIDSDCADAPGGRTVCPYGGGCCVNQIK